MNLNDFNQTITFSSATTQYSNIMQVDPSVSLVEIANNVSAIAGTTPSLAITAQVSYDGVNFDDRLTFPAITATGIKKRYLYAPGMFVRLKMVLTGTTPSATIAAKLQPRSNFDLTAPASAAVSVTPHDGNLLPQGVCRTIYIGTGGNISVLTLDGSTVTISVSNYSYLYLYVQRVNSTYTTATNIITLY